MKILFIINSLGTGGAEKLLLETIPLYKKNGIEIDILLLWDNDCLFTQQLRELQCCKIFILKKSKKINVIYNPLSVFKIAKILKNYKFAHVHLFPAQYFAVLANKLNGSITKLIYTEHSTNNRRQESSLYGMFDNYVYSSYESIICITKEIKEILIKHTKLPTQKFHLIENGVSVKSISDALPFERNQIHSTLSSADKIVIQVAGFRKEKDHVTLIKAMSILPKNYKLVLVGDGELLEECLSLVQALQIQDRVVFLGVRMDVPRLLKSSDIVVLSSKFEGLSLSSIEGMASGKPFIGSDVPGLNEIVNGAGILFPLGDEEQLAFEIKKLIDNPDLYSAISYNCQKKSQEYDIEKMVKKHLEIYESFKQYK